GRHAARRCERRATTFESGHALLERGHGGIREARVHVAEGLEVEQARGVIGAVEDEARRLVDGQRARAGGGVGYLPRVDREGLRMKAPVVHAARRAEMTPVLTPAQCKPPKSRACSIFTQRFMTESSPASTA